MKKLILHIPHSSIHIPFKEGYVLPEYILNQEILKLTDWYTHELFFSKKDEIIKADFSRIFCDVERFSDDSKEEMASVGMGALYERTDSGEIMRIITPELRKKILDDYYWKHHQKLNKAVNYQLEKNGKAIIIDCHSLSNTPFQRDKDKTSKRTDFSIGTDLFHTSAELYSKSVHFFYSKNIEIEINKPYSGTIVPLEHYKQNSNVLSIMIEINRKIYMDENSQLKTEKFNHVKQIISEYMEVVRTIL